MFHYWDTCVEFCLDSRIVTAYSISSFEDHPSIPKLRPPHCFHLLWDGVNLFCALVEIPLPPSLHNQAKTPHLADYCREVYGETCLHGSCGEKHLLREHKTVKCFLEGAGHWGLVQVRLFLMLIQIQTYRLDCWIVTQNIYLMQDSSCLMEGDQ